MKAFGVTLMFCFALFVAANAPIRARLVSPGEAMNITTQVLADGSKFVLLEYIREPGGIVRQESTYASDGTPIRLQQEVRLGGEAVRRVVAIFQENDVEIRLTAGGSTRVSRIALPDGSLQAQSEWWFLRDQPIEGEVVRFWRLDLSTLDWIESRVVYEGRREGLHRVVLDENVFLFGDDGQLQEAQMAGRTFR